MLDQQDASQIKRPLPPLVQHAVDRIGLSVNDLMVATDTDLAISGEYQESWLLVAPNRLLVFSNDEEDQEAILLKDLSISEVEDARMDTRVGSAFLEVKAGETYEEIIRFSNKHADKFARVASRIRSLSEGKQVKSDPEDTVLPDRCPKCGVRLPDKHMSVCPRCLKRGQVFFRFLGYVRGYWPSMILMLSLVIGTIILSLVPAPLTQVLIDHVLDTIPPKGWFLALLNAFNVGGNKVNWLLVLVGALAVARLFMAVLQWLREWLSSWVMSKLGYELRRDVFHKLQEMSVSYHDTHPVGHLMTRCTQDIEALQMFISQLTSGFGFQIIQLVSVAVVMLFNNVFLTFLAVLPVPLVIASTYIRYHNIVPRWRRFWTNRSSLSGMLHGALNGVRVVKAFAQESREEGRFAKYSGRYRDSGIELGFANAWFYPLMGWVFQIGSYFIWVFGGLAVIMAMSARTSPSAGALWAGSALSTGFGGPAALLGLSLPVEAPLSGWRSIIVGLTGNMTKGDLVEFLAYMAMFYAPINQLTQMSTWFTQFTTQAHRVFEVLDEDPEIRETDESVDLEMQGAVRFRQVTFGYDPHIPVLRDVEFRVEPGEMVGIVGHSGSGKSTCINLLMRFHDVDDGEVSIDNVSIQNIRKLSLRRQVGLVAQDPFLFRGTIAENIAYGNPGAAPQQVLNAALAADAHMFITRNHDGYDTMLGERGAGLSGGERQRVAIARALLNNPRILILDEATSSVDTIAEREIQKALEALSLGRTTIAIAHRLSTLRNCDRILVFEEGTIKEQGSHDELIGLGGIYKRLVEIQTQLTSDVESVEALQAIEEINRAEKERRGIESRREHRQRIGAPRIRFLNPKNLRIYSKDEGGMRVEYEDDTWDNVRAYRCFPVSRPGEFIAMWVGASALEQKEVGMIRRLKELQPSSRMAVELELAKRYFIHYIQRIVSIEEEMGFLNWQVETDKGEMEFMTRRNDRNAVHDTPLNGQIILDLDKNRYEIEDIDALDPASRAIFQKYVF